MELYPFQQETLDKFRGKRVALIADDMGLGKTVQAIALDREKRTLVKPGGYAPTLIVAPIAVHNSWKRHLEEWQSQLKVSVINPKARHAFEAAIRNREAHVYIVHWESLRLMDALKEVRWFHIIADECHRMKNRKAQQTQALRRLESFHKTALSGTPADNRPDDIWSVLNWLEPKVWTSYWSFYGHYVIQKSHNVGMCNAEDCNKYHKTAYKEVLGLADAAGLHAKMKHLYIRREKRQVLKDLPEKYFDTVNVELHPQQRRAYDQMRDNMLAWVGENEHQPMAAPIVVAQLMRLQQFAAAYGEIEEYKKTVKRDDETFEEVHYRLKLTDPSSKLDAAMSLIEGNPEVPIVVFAQSKQLINMLVDRCNKAKIAAAAYTGDTKQADRDRIVDDFQTGKLTIFAGTIAAGGEGITLTRASAEIFIDRTWSPAKNVQAEDRCHRIGQRNAVQIIDIVADDTVDRGRLQKIESKWEVIKELLGDKKDKSRTQIGVGRK